MYIKNNNSLEIGEKVILNKSYSSLDGTFTKGSLVTITGYSYRGYDIRDDEGNSMCEIGFDIGKRVECQ